uniref:uncharacterized protein LOC122596959 isoform X1 n=1 Tax=Erigeron canadensis TaxID=72917 RepID=UPI001CB98267|nr:uncharacterized protein LOC122596959 isoform X1 [Erigeron canadensis]
MSMVWSNLQDRIMADALLVRVEQFINYFRKFCRSHGVEGLDAKVKMPESFDGLMNHLINMMIGYETEEVHILLKEMEGPVLSEAWYIHEETVIGQKLEPKMVVNEDWYIDQIKRLNRIVFICEQLCKISYNSKEEEAVVVFENDQIEFLLDQLTENSAKPLQVISIAGINRIGID